MSYEISKDCIGCGLCVKKCPYGAIDGEKKKRFEINPALCEECGACFVHCPKAAIVDPHGIRRVLEKGKRKDLKASIAPNHCAGCQNCLLNCPQEAISFTKKMFGKGYCQVDTTLCIGCGKCMKFCITGAITIE